MNLKMTSHSVKTDLDGISIKEMTHVEYSDYSLRVKLSSDLGLLVAEIYFPSILGFRILDEGDLLEFWSSGSLGKGFIYKITSGGWFDQESKRKGFVHAHTFAGVEYFIATENMCASIFSETDELVVTSLL